MNEILVPYRPDDKACRVVKSGWRGFLLVSWADTKGKSAWGGKNPRKLTGDTEVFNTVSLNDCAYEGGLPAAPYHSYPALTTEQLARVEGAYAQASSEEDFIERVRAFCPLGFMTRAYAMRPPRIKDLTKAGRLLLGSNTVQQSIVGPGSIPSTKSFGLIIKNHNLKQRADLRVLAEELERVFNGLDYGAVLLIDGEEIEFGPKPYSGNMRLRWEIGGPSTYDSIYPLLVQMHKDGDFVGLLGNGFNIVYRTQVDLAGLGHITGQQVNEQYHRLRKGQSVDMSILEKLAVPDKKWLGFGL